MVFLSLFGSVYHSLFYERSEFWLFTERISWIWLVILFLSIRLIFILCLSYLSVKCFILWVSGFIWSYGFLIFYYRYGSYSFLHLVDLEDVWRPSSRRNFTMSTKSFDKPLSLTSIRVLGVSGRWGWDPKMGYLYSCPYVFLELSLQVFVFMSFNGSKLFWVYRWSL